MKALLLLYLVPHAASFQVLPQSRSASRVVALASSEDEHHISFNPMAGYQSVNVERAKACAEHFGECTVEEMQSLRDNLHKERLQKFMFGSSNAANSKAWEDSLEHRLLEEELDLQLQMLKDHEERDPPNMLFPEVGDLMEELPHLTENSKLAHDKEVIHSVNQALALDETVMEESVLETIAMCATVVALWFLPHLLHV